MRDRLRLLFVFWIILLRGSHALREGPRIVQEPPSLVTFPNTVGTSLSCVASATPAPTITWVTGDGARADNMGGLRMVMGAHGNSTLTLIPFSPDQYRHDIHVATYRCLASNNVGTVTSRSVSVNAVVMQRFELGVSDASGVVGGPAVFTCDVPPTVSRHVSVTSWTVDGRNIAPSQQPDGRYWVLPSGELVIQNVAATDAYTRVTCTASHAFDPSPRTSNNARVIVTGDPRLSRPQLLLRRDLVRPWTGDDLILPCLARGHPTPSVMWYKDDETRGRVSVGSNGRVQIIGGQLLLSSLRQDDAGHYLCIANNSAGSDSYRVEVQVRERLSVVVEPSLQRIDLGRPARLSCQVSGSPVNSVFWYKDGRPLPPLPRITTYDRTLHISQVSREDGGMYQCLVKNEEDSAQGVAQLDLGDSAPVLEYRFISQTLQPGPSVSLKCIASGAPTPHVSWSLDGFPLPQHERLVVGQYVGMGGSVVSHVNLTGVRPEDGGAYTCTASNRAGSTYHTARLNVYGPAYVRPMSVVTAVAGEQLFMSCPAAGYPLERIIWSRDGRNLPVTARQSVLENGTLVVRHVEKMGDSGEYTCTAQDKQGRTHSSTATVQVLVPPKLSSFHFRRDLTLGERVSTQCAVNGGDTPLQIVWTKDGAPAEAVGGIQVRLFDQYTSVLTITHLTPVHAGNYTCTATNDAASVHHTAMLHVNVPPSWLEAPRDSSVILGGSVHIPCHAQGFPTPKINWRRTRDDQPGQYSPVLNGGLGLGVGVASNGSLVVMGARSDDEGQYLCEASNGVGGGLSALVTLTVNAPPRFSPGLQRTVSVRRGSRASLVCQVLGDPPITLLWQASHASTHDNSMVREVDGGVRGELTIPSVSMEDAGEYTCSASNTYGRDSYIVTLVVQDVPGSPHGLRVSERGSRFLSVSWLPPSTAQTAIDKYIVQFIPAATGSWSDSEEVIVDGNTHTTQLSPLLPDTEYLVRLLAANHLGSSPHSEPLQVRTEGEAPSAPPTGVRADAVSASSIRVMWEPPPGHTHHGDLLGYNLGIRRQDVGGDGSYNFTVVGVGVGGNNGREIVAGLSPWAQYAVVLRAYNSHGPGPLSSPVVVRTMEDVPSAAPVGVECSGSAGGSSLIVRWAPPPPSSHNGILQGYRVTLTRVDETTDEIEEMRKTSNGREETVSGLRAWTNYTVNVAAVTRAGVGVASHDLTCTTKEDVAGIPRGLRALQTDSAAALLTWLAPSPPTGVLLAYTLHHKPPHARSPIDHPLHAHTNSHTLTSLSRGTHEFWMTARTRVGEGPRSPSVKLTMLEHAPPGVASSGGLVVSTQGEDVRLPCVTVGNPQPRPVWMRRGRQLRKNARFSLEDGGSLIIRGIERGDSGNYSCSIHPLRNHPYVHTSATYNLHVQVPPSAPSVHISDKTTSTLTVSWAAGDTGGAAVRAWAVWWRIAAGGGSWHTRELGRTYTSHVIKNLQCGAEYQVYVTARTHVGLSPPSRPLIARTSGSSPVAPPTRHVASGNSTGAWVWLGRWKDGGCPITHFTLQMRSPASSSWTTLASSLAPQDVYEVGGLRPGMNIGLRLTAHNAAGATTTTVNVHTGPGGGLGAQPAGGLEEAPPNHLHTDPRLLASAAASALALALTVAAAVLCLRRRAAAGRRSRTSQEDQEAEENKANLLHQRDSYYATVRKPQPVPATLERIPEYSEDIYPYATFQLGEGRGQDDTATAKFQTFVFQDSRYGVTEAHPPTSPTRPTPIKAHGRTRSHGRGVGGPRSESEEYDSLQSDTDTEHATSSRTESSIHLDSATLESHATLHLPLDPHLATLEGGRVDPHLATLEGGRIDPHLATLEGRVDPLASRRSGSRNVHHNLIYHAPESSTSTEPSPICERKSFPRKIDISKMGRVGGAFTNRGLSKMAANIRGIGAMGIGSGGGGTSSGGGAGGGGNQETSLSIPKKSVVTPAGSDSKSSDESKYGFTRRITPPVGFSGSHNELSEAECDLEIRKRNKEAEASGAPPYVGHPRSQFRSYAASKDNKDYSIKV